MLQADRYKLHFGPYRTPSFKYGQKVQCALRGELTIVRVSAGRIPWPIGKGGRLGQRSLVLYRGLARAVQKESLLAVCHWWGAGTSAVWRWRKVLGVPQSNPGTHRLYAANALSPLGDRARAAGAKAWGPKRRQRISAALRGRKRPAASVAKMRATLTGRKLSAKHRRHLSESIRRRKIIPPAAGVPWSAKEEALLRRLPAREVAERTGRTLPAVYSRRAKLGLNQGRTERFR